MDTVIRQRISMFGRLVGMDHSMTTTHFPIPQAEQRETTLTQSHRELNSDVSSGNDRTANQFP